jgi:hypothetical protein
MPERPEAPACRAEAVLRGRFRAFFQALESVGLWPEPVADESVWWVQWSYQWVHLMAFDGEGRARHGMLLS